MIYLDNISKYYNNGTTVTLGLRKINLKLEIGEFVAITGESGSGKSTLLNVISGLDTYEEGEMYVDNETTSHYDAKDWENYRRDKIGFIFQNYNLIDSYTVLENVETSLLIQGYSKQEAYDRAIKIISTVDLQDRIKNRASQLSSGQKQRLAIARALAKDTDIIVADEPTGNLDKENSQQIVELLHKLSKDKLVIMVTHNYDEVENYVTRKIRMFDGEIASDEKVNEKITEEHTVDNKLKKPAKKMTNKKTAMEFVKMNIKSQPKKVCILFLFLLFTAISSFIFLGSFISNFDDTSTKVFEKKAFLNPDDTRLVIRRADGGVITDDDMNYFNSLDKVIGSSKYDLACDMNYLYKRGKDFKAVYGERTGDLPENEENEFIVFNNFSNFIRPVSTNKYLELSDGRMPEAYNEVVLYSNDKEILNQSKRFYFTCQKKWSADSYIAIDMKVVGLLKESTNTVYFSDSLCRSLTLSAYGDESMYLFLGNEKGEYRRPVICTVTENKELNSDEALISLAYIKKNGNLKCNIAILATSKKLYHDELSADDDITFIDGYNYSSIGVIDVSHEKFEKLYEGIESHQAALYIEDYAYADKIIDELAKSDYVASSPFRIGSTKYSQEKVRARLVTMVISISSLFVVFLLEILVIRALLKYKKTDFIILKLIGMNDKIVKLINYFELFIYDIVSICISILIIMLLYNLNVSYVVNIVKYYTVVYYVLFVALNVLTVYILSKSYNQFLSDKFSITTLTEY